MTKALFERDICVWFLREKERGGEREEREERERGERGRERERRGPPSAKVDASSIHSFLPSFLPFVVRLRVASEMCDVVRVSATGCRALVRRPTPTLRDRSTRTKGGAFGVKANTDFTALPRTGRTRTLTQATTSSDETGSAKRALELEQNSVAWLNLVAKKERVDQLTQQLKVDLLRTTALFERPIFTTALIAGDVVILDAMHRCGLLEHIPVVFMDTLHLFNETLEFLEDCEQRYDFQCLRYLPLGCESKKDWNKKYASDLYMTDVEAYDQHAKVEPLNRALTELEADAWINGRRRDHGFDRAFLDVYEEGNQQCKINLLAHWTFRDCWDYLELNQVPYHPLHDEGYPSVGDLQSTLPVAKEKWFEYAGERSGRWNGENKTECGIHTFEQKRE